MEQETPHVRGRRFGRGIREGSAYAALLGALIGALAGLAGSVLVYVETEKTQHAAAADRRADIRRAAYVQLGTASDSFVTEFTDTSILVAEGNEARRSQFDDKFIPALTSLAQAEMAARLVGTDTSRALLAQAVQHRKNMQTVLAGAVNEKIDPQRFTSESIDARTKYTKAMKAFLDKVDSEVL
ncbi:hypothetical protein ACGFZB_41155 [Streptomyces cinerochromogenes]|uniref:Uncharacterized protein n=1 Tax=Streptomyces cinerochromogenes TaxID=66422 RepID=A0ABW7BHU7_9ACTN